MNPEQIELSLVVPAFNEERRLAPTLLDMIDYLDRQPYQYEIIVVDDGSQDGTVQVVEKFEKIRAQIKLVSLRQNRGKGFAVKSGMLSATGKMVLFADADGATPIAELERLIAPLRAGADVAIGSRALFASDTKVETRWYRKYLGRTFNFFVNSLVLPDVADTQCGFKMFSARAAKFIFERQAASGYSFDVEILFIAKRAGLKVVEVPINWHNVPGSKVNLILDSLRMFRDILRFRWRHRAVTPQDYSELKA